MPITPLNTPHRGGRQGTQSSQSGCSGHRKNSSFHRMINSNTGSSVTFRDLRKTVQHLLSSDNHEIQRPKRWVVDHSKESIVDFDMKQLREDLLLRLRTKSVLYTLEECRILMREMVRTVGHWLEAELPQLLFLARLHQKMFPTRQFRYQFPPCALPTVPFDFSAVHEDRNCGAKLSKIIEEINKSVLRMIDILYSERRERLLFAARMIEDLETVSALRN